MDLAQALETVQAGASLTRAEAREVFATTLGGGSDPVLLAGLLTSLAQRGETAAEITGAAEALRESMLPFEHGFPDAVDTCGTGGDGLGSFNLSTAAALAAAAAGARVVKHGNRSVSSRCGSADLLEAAGLVLELPPRAARAVLEEAGIVFLYAPSWHPAMRHAAPVRRALGIRTLFNFAGPLANPGAVRRQLLGVCDARRLDDFAGALVGLGHERALVVHGAGGADELTLAGGNQVRAVGVPAGRWEPEELGLAPAPVRALAGGDTAVNLGLLREVLQGAAGPLRDAVLLNSGAALVVAGVARTPGEGVARARETLDSGSALRTLERMVRTSRKTAAGGVRP